MGLDLFCVRPQTISAGTTQQVYLGIEASVYRRGSFHTWMITSKLDVTQNPLRLASGIVIRPAAMPGEISVAIENTGTLDYDIKQWDVVVQAVPFQAGPWITELVSDVTVPPKGAVKQSPRNRSPSVRCDNKSGFSSDSDLDAIAARVAERIKPSVIGAMRHPQERTEVHNYPQEYEQQENECWPPLDEQETADLENVEQQ